MELTCSPSFSLHPGSRARCTHSRPSVCSETVYTRELALAATCGGKLPEGASQSTPVLPQGLSQVTHPPTPLLQLWAQTHRVCKLRGVPCGRGSSGRRHMAEVAAARLPVSVFTPFWQILLFTGPFLSRSVGTLLCRVPQTSWDVLRFLGAI